MQGNGKEKNDYLFTYLFIRHFAFLWGHGMEAIVKKNLNMGPKLICK
jgi:hypothetical protein